jgi:hypothetical protein
MAAVVVVVLTSLESVARAGVARAAAHAICCNIAPVVGYRDGSP